MEKSGGYHFNSMENKHTFDISAFVCAYHFTSLPDFDPTPECYDFSQIFLVLDGHGSYTTTHGSFPLSPGMMFYRPAGRESIYRWETDRVTFGIISFVCNSPTMEVFDNTPIFLQEEERATLLDVIKTGVRICEPMRSDHPLMGMRYKPNTPDVVLDFLRASLERFFAMVYCRITGIDLLREQCETVSRHIDSSDLTDRVKAYLAAHLSEPLTLAEICRTFGTGQTALTKKFKQETTKGVIEYFTDLKIKEAKRRIRKTSMSFTEIAESLGFSSVCYFSKVFKQKTGVTPTEFSRYVSKRDTAPPARQK